MSAWRVSARERRILDDCCALGDIATPTLAAQDLVLSLPDDIAGLRETLTRHKAFTFFQSAVSSMTLSRSAQAAATVALSAVSADVETCRRHYDTLQSELGWLNRSGASEASGLVAIKGFSNARFYQKPGVRWSRDLDVYVKGWPELMLLVDALRGRQYQFDEQECAWLKADGARGRAEYGQVILTRSFGEDFSRVDIHFGTYSTGFDRYLKFPLHQFTDTCESGLKCLNATATLLVMFAHALSDGYVSIKDANDAAAIAASDAPVEWRLLRKELRSHSLAPQARLLSRYLLRRSRSDVVRHFAEKLHSACGPMRPSIWQMHNRDWHMRAAINASYTLRAGIRQDHTGVTAIIRMIQCFLFYARRLSVRTGDRRTVDRLLARMLPKADIIRWRLRPEVCVVLVQIGHPALKAVDEDRTVCGRLPSPWSTPLPGVSMFVDSGVCVVIAIAGDVFLPTLDLYVPPGQLRWGRQLAGRVQSTGSVDER